MGPETNIENLNAAEELEDMDAPEGYLDKKAPEYDPAALPDGHPAKQNLQKGMVLFRSEALSLVLPMDPPREKIENGHRIRLNGNGKVIRFANGEYWADPETPYTIYMRNGQKKEETEVEFLRRAIKENPAAHIREIKPRELSPAGQSELDESARVNRLNEMEPAEIRALFDSHELEQHKLQKAPKDKLIIKALLLNKSIPEDPIH